MARTSRRNCLMGVTSFGRPHPESPLANGQPAFKLYSIAHLDACNLFRDGCCDNCDNKECEMNYLLVTAFGGGLFPMVSSWHIANLANP